MLLSDLSSRYARSWDGFCVVGRLAVIALLMQLYEQWYHVAHVNLLFRETAFN